MRVRLIKDATTAQGPVKAGHEIEHDDSWRLIRLGLAVAIDDEAVGAMRAIGRNSKGELLPPGGGLPKPPPQVEAKKEPVTPTPKPTPKPVVKPVDGK